MVNFDFELIDFSGKNILPRVPGLRWEWALGVHLMRASPPQTLAKGGFQRALERRFQSPQSPCKMVRCCTDFMWEEAVLDWGSILLKLGEEVPAEAFNRCLKTLQAWEDDGALVLFAPNAYNRGVVVKAHLPRIRELRGGLVKVQVGASPKEEALGPLRAGAPSRASSVPTTKLAAAKTFEIFVPSGCNKAALKSAQDMADGRDCEPGILVLHGPVGVGKTHLLCAIGHLALQMHPNRVVECWRAHSFMTYLGGAFRKSAAEGGAAAERLRQSLRSIDVLLFDDAHLIVQGNKPRMQEELRRLVDVVLEQGGRMVLASKWHPNEFPHHSDEDLRARLASCLNVRLHIPGRDASARILAQMVENMRAGLCLRPEIVECILDESSSMPGWEGNCRQLEGSVRSVLQAAKANGWKVTKKLVRGALRVSPAAHRPIALDDIHAEIAHYYQVSSGDVRSKRKTQALVRARHMGMYLARQLTNCSYADIANAWGNRHHTTVKSAYDRMDALVKKDRNAADEARRLQVRIKARASQDKPPQLLDSAA